MELIWAGKSPFGNTDYYVCVSAITSLSTHKCPNALKCLRFGCPQSIELVFLFLFGTPTINCQNYKTTRQP